MTKNNAPLEMLILPSLGRLLRDFNDVSARCREARDRVLWGVRIHEGSYQEKEKDMPMTHVPSGAEVCK